MKNPRGPWFHSNVPLARSGKAIAGHWQATSSTAMNKDYLLKVQRQLSVHTAYEKPREAPFSPKPPPTSQDCTTLLNRHFRSSRGQDYSSFLHLRLQGSKTQNFVTSEWFSPPHTPPSSSSSSSLYQNQVIPQGRGF